MPSKRRFYKTTYTLEVLSEDPIPPMMDMPDVIRETDTGDYSGRIVTEETVELDGPAATEALRGQDSDPGFFQLTDDGEDVDDP